MINSSKLHAIQVKLELEWLRELVRSLYITDIYTIFALSHLAAVIRFFRWEVEVTLQRPKNEKQFSHKCELHAISPQIVNRLVG